MTLDTLVRTPTPNQADNAVRKDVCLVCSKVVYPMDKIAADDKIFHKTCLRCGHCKKVLSLGNYAALNNVFYCKPHFKQLFALKGNYSDGFKASEAAAGVPDEKGDKSPGSSSPAPVRASASPSSTQTQAASDDAQSSSSNLTSANYTQGSTPKSTSLSERMNALNATGSSGSTDKLASPSQSPNVPKSASLAERMNALTMKKDDGAKKEPAVPEAEAPKGTIAERMGMFGKSNASTPERSGTPASFRSGDDTKKQNEDTERLNRELTEVRAKLATAEERTSTLASDLNARDVEVANLKLQLAERDMEIASLKSQLAAQKPVEGSSEQKPVEGSSE